MRLMKIHPWLHAPIIRTLIPDSIMQTPLPDCWTLSCFHLLFLYYHLTSIHLLLFISLFIPFTGIPYYWHTIHYSLLFVVSDLSSILPFICFSICNHSFINHVCYDCVLEFKNQLRCLSRARTSVWSEVWDNQCQGQGTALHLSGWSQSLNPPALLSGPTCFSLITPDLHSRLHLRWSWQTISTYPTHQ
jgi:hypothetical protein